MKTTTKEIEALDMTIATLLEHAELWSDLGMEEEMQTALKAAKLMMVVREEREEGVE